MDTHVAKDGVLVHGPNYRISCSTTSSRGCSSSSSSGSQCCGGAPEYLFHLASTATWPVAPRVVFGIMTQCGEEPGAAAGFGGLTALGTCGRCWGARWQQRVQGSGH